MELTRFILKAIVYAVSFVGSFYALNAIDYNRFLKKDSVRAAQLLYMILAMALAYLVGSFILSFVYI